MYDNDEYDAMIELEFPYWDEIVARPDRYRPGMVHLDFKNLPFNDFTQDMLDRRGYLLREKVQGWMQSMLLNVYGRKVWGEGSNCYYLRYKPGYGCHTIIAESDSRTFSIDFVPAIKVLDEDWCECQVVPKYAEGPKRSHGCTFMVHDIMEETRLFQEGGELVQQAVMLLKALCETKGLPKIRNYHLVTCAISVIEYDGFQDFSLQDVFINVRIAE